MQRVAMKHLQLGLPLPCQLILALLLICPSGTICAAESPEPKQQSFDPEIPPRGKHQTWPITYSRWRKLCFKATPGDKMLCRTTITGTWDTGQEIVRVDLIERESDSVGRLQ